MVAAPKRRWFRFAFSPRTLFLVVGICLVGCHSETAPDASAPDAQQHHDIKKVLSQSKIESAAVTALVKQNAIDKDHIDVSSYRDGTDWYVMVRRLPEMPGGFSTVVLSDAGEIKEIIGGE